MTFIYINIYTYTHERKNSWGINMTMHEHRALSVQLARAIFTNIRSRWRTVANESIWWWPRAYKHIHTTTRFSSRYYTHVKLPIHVWAYQLVCIKCICTISWFALRASVHIFKTVQVHTAAANFNWAHEQNTYLSINIHGFSILRIGTCMCTYYIQNILYLYFTYSCCANNELNNK